MSRIKKTFAELKKRGEAALIPFITAGDPDLETTLKILRALDAGGADCIELGIPFSDPTADGPTIQRSSERALKRPVSLPAVFRLVHMFPPVVAGAGGSVRLFQSAFSLRPGALRLPSRGVGRGRRAVRDLPPEESGELKQWTDAVGLDLIFLLSPMSGADRIELVGRASRGFVYYVSVTGVTGARRSFDDTLRAQVDRVRRATALSRWVSVSASRRRNRPPGSPALPTRR